MLLKEQGVVTPVVAHKGNNFHQIRYILAALVLYSHSYGLLAIAEPGLFKYTYGNLAVKSFFAVSGYLITLSCVRIANLGAYTANRFLRLVPALVFAQIFSVYLGAYFGNFKDNPVPHILNGPIWTLPWEVVCYSICGLLWALGLLKKEVLGAVLAASWIFFVALSPSGETGAVIVPLFLLFFLGGYIALSESQLNLRLAGPIAVLVIALISIDVGAVGIQRFFSVIPFAYGPNFSPYQHYDMFFIFCLPFSLIWLAKYIPTIFPLRSDYSYGMYIYGWPVQQGLVALDVTSPLLLFVSSLFITHCLAMVSWHVIEKWVLKLKR